MDVIAESEVTEPARLITLQFLAWVADRPRTYADVMDAWRSTCPQLSVWEDAVIAGFVQIETGRTVALTASGRAMLAKAQAREACAVAPPSRMAAE